MPRIHSITGSEKVNSQNCRLKASLANFQIKGIVFYPGMGDLLLKRPIANVKNIQSLSVKPSLKFMSDTLLKGARIRGLSMQSTV